MLFIKKHKVTITETLQREIEVEAKNRIVADRIVRHGWDNSKYVLGADDFIGVDFEIEEVSDN